MKLSDKGLKKIQRWQDAKRLGHAYPVDEIEFEHDDFVNGYFQKGKDHIVLTTNEAEELAVTMFAYHKLCQKFLIGFNGNFLIKASKIRHILDKRIGQTEIKHLKKEITQLKKEQARDNLEIERLEESYKKEQAEDK